MIQLDEYKNQSANLSSMLKEAGQSLGIESMQEELKTLKEQMEQEGFWDDIESANKVTRKIRPLEQSIKEYESLTSALEDFDTLLMLEEEEGSGEFEEEIVETSHDLEERIMEFRLSALLNGEYDQNNAILSLHAGAGGTEAQDWTSMLYRMYQRWAERRRYKVKVLDFLDGEEAGVKSVTLLIEGLNAYGFLRSEKGVHRLVRISPFDANARRHTSFASVDVIPELDEDDDFEINWDEVRIDTYRSSGAGGQHVNKTDSAVRMTHIPTGIVVTCQNERSQIQNREQCTMMLKSKLADLKEQQRLADLAEIKGELKKIEWGSQIRSYVFQPYTMVKDHRTNVETGNITAVMDGDIDMFINAYLIKSK